MEASSVWVWLFLIIGFIVLESVSAELVSIWFAVGALIGLIISLFHVQIWLQILVFLVVSGLCLLAVRPLASKYLRPNYQPTNADRLINTQTVVQEEINPLKGTGAVSINGVIWSARSVDNEIIPVNTVVLVKYIEGVKLFVVKSKEEVICQDGLSF